MKPTTLLWFAAAVAAGACAGTPPPTTAENEQLTSVRALLPQHPDKAADAAEAILEQNPDLREARALLAECSLTMARSPDFQFGQLHLKDAARYFHQALDGADPIAFAREFRLLAETHYELGEWEQGSDAATLAAKGFSEKKGLANVREYSLARLVGARCDFRRFAEARQTEIDEGTADRNGVVPPEGEVLGLAQVAAAGFQEARREYPGEACNRLAEIQLWLGRPSEAMLEYERGLLQNPEASRIHDAYIDWMCRNGQQDALVGAYRRFVREKPDATLLVNYHGIALYARADMLRKQGNFSGAVDAYAKAREVFDRYLAVAPQDRENTNWWRALCDLSAARCKADAGDLDDAIELLFRADSTSPYTATYEDGQPRMIDTFGNHFLGCVAALGGYLTQAPEDALQRTMDFHARVLEAHPDQWGFVYNNAALAARDLGVQRHNEGAEDTADELWERSYRWYEKAVELSPDDARIANDCGLMLVYHLERDLDRARQLFDRAIEIGTRQLEALPEDADVRELQLLEEAVGDAWQNIAVLLREHRDAPFEDYKRFCEQAVKYYPYNRREAAALLRSNGEQGLQSTARAALSADASSGSAAGTAAAGRDSTGQSAAQQGGAAEAFNKAKPEIDAMAEQGNFDGALTALDKLSKDCSGYAPYYVTKGRMNWMLANQARDNGRQGVEFFYKDAANAFERAVELDPEPIEPRQLLAQAQYDSGDSAAATETLTALLLHMQSKGGGTDEQLLACHTLRANTAARAYAAAKQSGEGNDELLTAARTSLRFLEQKGQLEPTLLDLWSATERWAEAPAEAVNVYVRASERAPDDLGMLDKVVNVAAETGQLPLAIEAMAKRDDAGTLWYRGKAQFWLAGEQRQNGKPDEAMATLEQARQSFATSMQKNAGYRDSCEQWIAMCVGKQGNVLVSQEKWVEAEKHLMEALRLRPDRIVEDLGLSETIKGGVLWVVDHYMRSNNLEKVEAISRAAAEAAPNDVDLLNNSGLFARDYGNVLENSGEKDKAREMYEQSYKAYSKAHQLDPSNVRLRNDVALIAIYHLERDWELSKRRLDSAIADGTKVLEESPPENVEQRQQLEEAVGDCYENLALWHIKHSKDYQAAKEAAQKSTDFYPGARRPGARRHLQTAERLLQGK